MRDTVVPARGIKIEGFAAVCRLVSPFQHCFEQLVLGAKVVNDARRTQVELARDVAQRTSAVAVGGKDGCGCIKDIAGALCRLRVGTANVGLLDAFIPVTIADPLSRCLF